MHWTDGYVAVERARTCAKPLLNDLSMWMLNIFDFGGDPCCLFDNWQQLLGFEIGWATPDVANDLCSKYGVKPEDCEIVMMRANGLTECHLHEQGASTFLVLGGGEGQRPPSGGTLLADYVSGKWDYTLEPVRHAAGECFDIPADKIHAFFADPGEQLTLIGFVRPKIKNGNGFDVVPFDYVKHIAPVSVRKRA